MSPLENTYLAPTAFAQRVYAALQQVPAGRVTTYGWLAHAVGVKSAQAVGQALRRNPFAPAVPCHRVIAADLHLGGFHGARAGTPLAHKRQLLADEGVLFDAQGQLVEPWRLWSGQKTMPQSPMVFS
jgi:methylated-DNA-[protein]-cysteine S-methyltransferase